MTVAWGLADWLTRPVASVMVGELCGTRTLLCSPCTLLRRRSSRSVPSVLWRGLLSSASVPALGDTTEEARRCSSILEGTCKHRAWHHALNVRTA